MKFYLNKQIFCRIILFLTIFVLSGSITSVLAVTGTVPATDQSTFTLSNPLKVDSVAGLVQSFVEIFSYVVIIIAVLALIWVGFQFITARGDVTKMKELKEWLWWIVIGVAVVIGARVIVEVVINTLSLSGTVDPNTINSVRSAIGR